MEQLHNDIKQLIIDALNLEDLTVDDIETDAPLFGDGLGLDSIDALELGLAIKKQYNIVIDADDSNTREHFAIHGLKDIPFEVQSRWYEGKVDIPSYGLNELLGTKMRALYQRRKGRDLFDLAIALDHDDADPNTIIETFTAYMDDGGHAVSKTQFEDNLAAKMKNAQFTADIGPLLRDGYEWNLTAMAERITDDLIARLPEHAA